jgi:hypothetical protein
VPVGISRGAAAVKPRASAAGQARITPERELGFASVLPSGGGAERERMEAFLHRLKRLDAYPKVNEDFYKRTLSGGVVTVVAAVLMMLLFISETS